MKKLGFACSYLLVFSAFFINSFAYGAGSINLDDELKKDIALNSLKVVIDHETLEKGLGKHDIVKIVLVRYKFFDEVRYETADREIYEKARPFIAAGCCYIKNPIYISRYKYVAYKYEGYAFKDNFGQNKFAIKFASNKILRDQVLSSNWQDHLAKEFLKWNLNSNSPTKFVED